VSKYVTEQSAGDIVSNTFEIYRGNFIALSAIYFVPVAGFGLLSLHATLTGGTSFIVVAGFLWFFSTVFVQGAMAIAVSDICIGNQPSFVRSYETVSHIIGRYIGTIFVVVSICSMGVLLLLVPGIIAGVLLMFTMPVVILERKGVVAALKRSIQLGKGAYWRNFGVFYLLLFIYLFIVTIISFILGIILALIGANPNLIRYSGSVTPAIFGPIGSIPLVLLYYDMRVRKENFDTAALSQELLT
jgi:uncharacterized protein UPF0259/glycerophosphoryl diester phosphodiesterase family protein